MDKIVIFAHHVPHSDRLRQSENVFRTQQKLRTEIFHLLYKNMFVVIDCCHGSALRFQVPGGLPSCHIFIFVPANPKHQPSTFSGSQITDHFASSTVGILNYLILTCSVCVLQDLPSPPIGRGSGPRQQDNSTSLI